MGLRLNKGSTTIIWPISGNVAWSDYLSCPPFNARAKMKFAHYSAYLLRKSHILYFIPILDRVLKNAWISFFVTSKMGRLNEVQRHRAFGLVEGGLSFREVGRRMGCSHQTIMKLVERNANTGSVCDRQRRDAKELRHVNKTDTYSLLIFGIGLKLQFKQLRRL